MKNTVAYLRVSTDKQDAEKQKFGIMEYANKHGMTKVSYIEDTASGKISWKKRSIGKLVEQLGKGDVILCAEISRLARSTLEVLEILELTAQKGIDVHIVKQNLIFKEEGDITSTIMATMLGLIAQIEREFISQRTKEALAKTKANGTKLGRPKGKAKHLKLDEKRDEIHAMLNAGASKRSVARIVDCTPATLYAWLRREKIRISQKRKSELTPQDMEFLGQKRFNAA